MSGAVGDAAPTFWSRLARRLRWRRWPFPLSVALLVLERNWLRRARLFDQDRDAPSPPPSPPGFDHLGQRMVDGSWNDLEKPAMGMAGRRFGRNVPLRDAWPDQAGLMRPNPRLVSETFLARDQFKPATGLNLHAAAWLQFMVHDWFVHAHDQEPANRYRVPLPEGDDWRDEKDAPAMEVRRTLPDQARFAADAGMPPTFRNRETHWWDASQIYGSTRKRLDAVRGGRTDGKLALDDDGHLPLTSLARGGGAVELAGVRENWWLGLSILHTIFAREHNAIVDRIRIDHPDRDGEWLFQKARLVVAALIAKIHTVEWTPALLGSTTLRYAMRGAWWGVLGEEVRNAYGRFGEGELLSGIPGSTAKHFSAPYAITEEFVAVYRMHPLIPDDFALRRAEDDGDIQHLVFQELAGRATHGLWRAHGGRLSLEDAAYSFGAAHPGALVLRNFPGGLRRLELQGSRRRIDLGAIDVLRDRERGVPRYARFRELMGLSRPESFLEIASGDPALARELEAVYGAVDEVDLLVGCLAEKPPEGFAFSETAFVVFMVMASRRILSDRFFCQDYRPEIYTQAGFDWAQRQSFSDVLRRHMPGLAPHLEDVVNPFRPWRADAR